MYHVGENMIPQDLALSLFLLRDTNFIWALRKLRQHHLVNLIRCFWPISIRQYKKDVGMWQSTFLPLNNPKVDQHLTKDSTFGQQFDEMVFL